MIKNIFIPILFIYCATLFAQEPIRYTTKQGLPSNHVYDVAEDANGFIWFATKQGLVKYDGETFKNFTIKEGLPNNDTWLIEPDLQGRLWYFSKSAYQGYIKNDSIYNFATKDKEVITPRFIYKAKDSLWFFGTLGLQTFSKKNIISTKLYSKDEIAFFTKKSLAVQQQYGFDRNRQMPAYINPESKEYILLSEKQLLIFDWNLNFKKELPIKIPLEYVDNVKIQNNGLLYNQIGWFAMGKGVLFVDFKTYTTSYKSFKELIGKEDVKYFRCRSLKDEFQISVPGHLMIFDYELTLKKIYSFSEALSQSSFKDSKGNIWLTDLANGVSLITNTTLKSSYYLQNEKVQKINLIQNNFYAGINDKGFYKLDKKTNNFQILSQFSKSNAEVYQIKEDAISKQNYFISSGITYTLNELRIKELNFQNPQFLNIKPLSPINGIKDMVSFNNSLYLITGNFILKERNPKQSLINIVNKSGLLFTDVFMDTLFVAGSDGLHQVINDTLKKPKLKNELLDVSVSSLTTTKDNLYVGTDGRGVYLYDKKGVFHLKETDGLSVQRILATNDTLWLATQKGVQKVVIERDDLNSSIIVDAFYESDGLLQNNTNDIYVEDNFLYAASDMGLAKLDLSNPVYKQTPEIYFKTTNDTLRFKNGERDNIAVSYALQNFVNQDRVTYQYRLLPIQKEWITTETKILNFSNLSPAIYTLEIKAIDQHNNQSIAKQYLKIIPAWWQTLSAKIGFGLAFILVLYILYRYLKHRIQKNEQAKSHQEKRVAGLELQALRSQMNPHFVHNSLNAIQYFIQRKEVELSENYLSKFSQLIRLFFEYSRRQTITIEEELELLTNYLDIEKLRFEEKLEYEISVCKNIDIEEQLIPSMLLQPFVENAVNHGIFHKKENGKVEVRFKQLDTTRYQVIIRDDGIGINSAKKLFKTSSKNYRSNSSKVLQERLELLNKSKEWEIVCNIQDISELEKDKTGTLVTLVFKQII